MSDRAGHRRWVIALGAALLILGASGCSRSPSGAGTSTTSWTVPDPDRSGMQPQVARTLEQAADAVRARLDNAAAWGRYGALLDAHDLDTAAATCYERAQRLDAADFRWPYLRANLMEQFDRPADEIVAQYRAAAKIEPGFPPTYFRMGEVLSRLGRLEEAREAYRQALRLDPDRLGIAHRSLGQVLLLLGDATGALEHLQRADAITPGDRSTTVSLAQALRRLGRTREAEAAAARSTTLPERLTLPDPVRFEVESMRLTVQACHERAVARLVAGDAPGSLQQLAILETVSSDDPYYWLQVGAAYMAVRRADLAVPHLVRAANLAPDLAPAQLQLGSAYLGLGRLDDAERHLRRAIELDDRSAAAHARLATVFTRRQQFDQAVAEFEEAQIRGELDATAQANWGTALLQRGDAAASLPHFRAAIRLRPNYVAAHYNFALALEQVGRLDEAVVYYRQTVRLDPNHRARQRLAELGVRP